MRVRERESERGRGKKVSCMCSERGVDKSVDLGGDAGRVEVV